MTAKVLVLNCPTQVYLNSDFECELSITSDDNTKSGQVYSAELTLEGDGSKTQMNYSLRDGQLVNIKKLKYSNSGKFMLKAVLTDVNGDLNVNPVVKSRNIIFFRKNVQN